MHPSTRFKVAFMSVVTAFALAAPLRAQVPVRADDVSLAPGDVARLTVWRQPEFSGDLVVAQDGSLTHPLLHHVKVAGVPLSVAEERIRDFLKQYDANPEFSFYPLLRVYVLGEVRTPSTYTVPPGTTVAEAVALAGGSTTGADMQRVRLVRGNEQSYLDLTRPDLEMAHTTVRSGDEIVVGRKTNALRDNIGPISAVIAALATVANLYINIRH
jgi:polysaccharide export outer membrane protein